MLHNEPFRDFGSTCYPHLGTAWFSTRASGLCCTKHSDVFSQFQGNIFLIWRRHRICSCTSPPSNFRPPTGSVSVKRSFQWLFIYSGIQVQHNFPSGFLFLGRNVLNFSNREKHLTARWTRHVSNDPPRVEKPRSSTPRDLPDKDLHGRRIHSFTLDSGAVVVKAWQYTLQRVIHAKLVSAEQVPAPRKSESTIHARQRPRPDHHRIPVNL